MPNEHASHADCQPAVARRAGLRGASDPDPIPRAALALCGLFLSLTAIALTTLDHLKYRVLAAPGASAFRLLQGVLGPLDATLAGVALLAILAAVALEWRYRAVRCLLAGERPGWLIPPAAGAALWFCHATMAPGLLTTGDAGAHLVRISHLAMAVRDGRSLLWDNDFFGGGPLLLLSDDIGGSPQTRRS